MKYAFIIPGLLAILLVVFSFALSIKDPINYLVFGRDAVGEETLFILILLLFFSIFQTILLIPAWRRVPKIWIVSVTVLSWALFITRGLYND